jgi:flagellar basal body-associated protein FliL
MPPPQFAPKRAKSRKRLWLIIAVVVLVLIVIIAVASQAGNSGQPTTTTKQATQPASTGQPSQPTLQPTTPQSQPNVIGKPVQVANTWSVTVNSVRKSTGDDISQPKNGNTFIIVNVTLKNISSSNLTASSGLMFQLKDQTGQIYTEQFTSFAKSAPDGTVSPGSLLRGELVYEVPSSMHAFTFSFQRSFLIDDLVEWKVTI